MCSCRYFLFRFLSHLAFYTTEKETVHTFLGSSISAVNTGKFAVLQLELILCFPILPNSHCDSKSLAVESSSL